MDQGGVSDLLPPGSHADDSVSGAAAAAAAVAATIDFDTAAISPMKALAAATQQLSSRGRGSRRSSGIPGVSWHPQTGDHSHTTSVTSGVVGRWVARWTGEDKKEHSKGFSSKRHGDAKALQMAVGEWR